MGVRRTRGDPGHRAGHRAGQRGSVTIETVVLVPALFALMFTGVQAGLWYHARTVALAAAQEGARAAALEGATAGQGTTAALAFVAAAGGADVLPGVTATGTRTPATASVTVSGTALSVVPGWTPSVTQTATYPVERITG